MSQALKVLVVEDEADVRLALSVLLSRVGLDVVEAGDGRAGLRALFAEHPDCVILDVGLPDLDGWEVLGRIRDVSEVPVLMLTA